MNVPITIQVKSGGGTFLSPDLAVENRVPSTLGKWWQRPALILPRAGGFSRKEVVLGLANKESGTHVDLPLRIVGNDGTDMLSSRIASPDAALIRSRIIGHLTIDS